MLNFNKNSNPKTDSEKDFIYIKNNEVFEKVYLNEIDFIESQKNYLLITTSNNTYRHRATITDFITRLPDNFMKTHKGFIVNSSKIQNFNSSFVTVAGQKIPISKNTQRRCLTETKSFDFKGLTFSSQIPLLLSHFFYWLFSFFNFCRVNQNTTKT